MSYQNIIDDESVFQEDEITLTDVKRFLPHVVWKIVLKNFKNMHDIETISNASPFFENLLQGERLCKVVVPKIFRIIENHFGNQDATFSHATLNLTCRAASSPCQMADLLKCRLVCKNWNQSIEDLHRDKYAGHFWMLEDFNVATNSVTCRKLGNETFWTESKIESFLNHFEMTHYDPMINKSKKCPFLGRSINVWPPERRDQNEDVYFNALLVLLRKYGDEIWYFREHYVGLNTEGYVYWYRQLNERVKLMPNLRVLRITWSCLTHESPEVLEREIARNPFPKLTKLQLLATFQVPGQILNHLVHKHRHVHSLQVLSNNLNFDKHYDIFTENLPNLTKLCFEARSIEDFEKFETYVFPLNLTKLSFCWSRLRSVPFIPWSRIFSAVESKLDSNCLTELHLNLPEPKTDTQQKLILEESLSCRLQVPNVRRILVQQQKAHFCIDFILPFKNTLEELHLCCDVDFTDSNYTNLRDRQAIKFLGFEQHIGESNIRSAIPRLKQLKITGYEKRRSVFGINEI